MTKLAIFGATGVVANPLLQQLQGMQFPQGGMGSPMGGMPMQQQMDPNMAAMLYQQQLLQQQQQQNPAQQAIMQVAAENEQLQQQQQQLVQYIEQLHQTVDDQDRRLFAAENPDALDPESVDRALCLSQAAEGSVWANMKERLLNVLGKTTARLPIDQGRKLLDNVLQQFTAAENASQDCGMGVLSLHLLNAITMDDTEESKAALVYIFTEYEPLSSPVLTLLLDLPWQAIHQSGWPLFQLLSQVHHRKIEIMDLDELNGFNHTATKNYWTELQGNLGRRDWDAIRTDSENFIDNSLTETPSQLAMLTSFLGQGMKTNETFREGVLAYTQGQFKKMVQGGADMDAVLGSAWPFFDVLAGFFE